MRSKFNWGRAAGFTPLGVGFFYEDIGNSKNRAGKHSNYFELYLTGGISKFVKRRKITLGNTQYKKLGRKC